LAGGTGLGAGFEDSHVVRNEVQAHHPIEKSGGFVGRKAQVELAQFGQLTTRAQTSQGLTTGQFYGCANLLASWAGKDAVCAADLGSEATATSCGIRDLCV